MQNPTGDHDGTCWLSCPVCQTDRLREEILHIEGASLDEDRLAKLKSKYANPRFILEPYGSWSKTALIKDSKSYFLANVDISSRGTSSILKTAQIVVDILNENAHRIPED
jgi:hypothetical protein